MENTVCIADDVTTQKTQVLHCCVLDRVYRAVAWQHVDEIRYNIEENVWISAEARMKSIVNMSEEHRAEM
jgi:hypothetical protein